MVKSFVDKTNHIMDCNHLAYKDMANKNQALREVIIQNLKEIKDDRERLIWLRNFFLQSYDYDYSEVFNDAPGFRDFEMNGKAFRTHTFAEYVPYYNQQLSPSVHLIKLAQCTVYAKDVKEILEAVGTKTTITQRQNFPCFNKYNKKLESIGHVFNAITLRHGQKVNFDVCSAIMTRDAQTMNCDINYKLLQGLNT